jgi:hypothetical protein
MSDHDHGDPQDAKSPVQFSRKRRRISLSALTHPVSQLDLTGLFGRPIFAVALLTLLVSTLFVYSVHIRRPWFGTLSDEQGNQHQWLSGHTLKDAKNWYREGPLTLKFASWWHPRSIEFPTLESRGLYISYPPGYIAPIYLIGKITGREPTAGMLMTYNLFNHFLIALLLALTLFVYVKRLGLPVSHAVALSLVPCVIEFFVPGTLYWHQNVFFADQAIILPFVFVVFVEMLLDCYQKKAKLPIWLGIAQRLMMFYGLLTDWFFVFVVTVLYLKRLTLGQAGSSFHSLLKKGLRFWALPCLALLLFAVQVDVVNGWTELVYAGLRRAHALDAAVPLDGDSSQSVSMHAVFWGHHIPLSFGPRAALLLSSSLLAWVFLMAWCIALKIRQHSLSRDAVLGLSLMFLVLVPPFTQVYMLKQHSVIHSFSALKFAIPLSLVPFVVLPLTLRSFLSKNTEQLTSAGPFVSRLARDSNIVSPMLVLFFFVLAIGFVAELYPRRLDMFSQPTRQLDRIGPFIDNNTGYHDIVVSPNFAVESVPPQWLSYTMKRIYRVYGIEDICKLTQGIEGDYVVNIFINEGKSEHAESLFAELTSQAITLAREGQLRLYKVPKMKFLAIAQCHQ